MSRIALLALLLVVLGGCAMPGASPSFEPTDPPVAHPSVLPTEPDRGEPGDGAVVTFRVAGAEEYRILLTLPGDVEHAERLLSGDYDVDDADFLGTIPVGRVVRGDQGGVNDGWSWHIDPGSFEWAGMTIEVCDGRPSDVEGEVITSDQFCPWSAEVVAVDPVTGS